MKIVNRLSPDDASKIREMEQCVSCFCPLDGFKLVRCFKLRGLEMRAALVWQHQWAEASQHGCVSIVGPWRKNRKTSTSPRLGSRGSPGLLCCKPPPHGFVPLRASSW